MKKLKLVESKDRPGKREADLAGAIISEGMVEEIERRSKLAGMDVGTTINRMLAIAITVAPDDPEEWDDWVDSVCRLNVMRRGRRRAR